MYRVSSAGIVCRENVENEAVDTDGIRGCVRVEW